jgi:hypothetical protein
MVDVEELIRMLAQLPAEEKERLLVELGAKKPRRERRKEVPAEVRDLVEKYQTLRQQLREVRQQLRELGYTPTGIGVRRGYGNYDYRGFPLYNTVKELIQSRRSISRAELGRAEDTGIQRTNRNSRSSPEEPQGRRPNKWWQTYRRRRGKNC